MAAVAFRIRRRSSSAVAPAKWSRFVTIAIVMIAAFAIQRNDACIMRSALRLMQNVVIEGDVFDDSRTKSLSIDDENVDIRYWNSVQGNNESIQLKYGHEDEIVKHWSPGLPLKVVIHGWLDSTDHNDGVFSVKIAYVDVGGYNVLTLNWGGIAANKNYMLPVLMTSKIGSRLAGVLDNLVKLGLTTPKDVHLIGHSLGAHIAGNCGSSLKSGMVGRITGLDPAGPGFEYASFQKKGLKKTDALFVDVIHTSGGSTGYLNSMGHADFYPNGGVPPQPGCAAGFDFKLIGLLGCCHSRAYKLYKDSIYNMRSLMAVQCTSWMDFVEHKCDDNLLTPMGHDASPEAIGDFYLRTRSAAPFAIVNELKAKEDL